MTDGLKNNTFLDKVQNGKVQEREKNEEAFMVLIKQSIS